MLFDDLMQAAPNDDEEERRRRTAALMQMQQPGQSLGLGGSLAAPPSMMFDDLVKSQNAPIGRQGPTPLGLGSGGGSPTPLGLGGSGEGELVPLAAQDKGMTLGVGTGSLFDTAKVQQMIQRVSPTLLSRLTSPQYEQQPFVGPLAQGPVAPPAAQPPDIPSMMGPPGPSMLDNYTPPDWAGWNSVRHDPIMPFTDSFMSPDPVHTLGVNGFRTGSSSPVVDYSGPLQRAHIMSVAKDMMDTFSRNQMELDRAKLMMGGKAMDAESKKEQIFNKNLALTSNPSIDTPQAIAKIKEMQQNKELTPSEANQAILKRVTTRRSADGKALQPLFHPDKDPQNPDMGSLMSALKSDEVKGMPPEDIKKFLQNSMEITDDMVKKRYAQLIQQGIPWYRRLGGAANPALFEQSNLNPDQQTEFEGINTIFGRK